VSWRKKAVGKNFAATATDLAVLIEFSLRESLADGSPDAWWPRSDVPAVAA